MEFTILEINVKEITIIQLLVWKFIILS